MSWFITGTDTGVGKTWFARLLVTTLREQGIAAAGYKPVACGDRDDALALAEASGGLAVDEVNPIYLKAAVAPKIAAMLDDSRINPGAILADLKQFEKRFDHVVVEGAGGWRVPLADDYDMADLATDIAHPVIVVVANRLGALNHTILTVEDIRASGLEVAGLVLNHLQDELDTAAITNKGVIEELVDAPILAEIIHGQDFLDLKPFLTSAVSPQ
ncbi:dethiobiotin synthetase [Haloferula luteola]|uniref:ATP-dependent dethiobiotin synthetase BioD n=1 Tax=Haloferula luteola TaxID=595692 RepID=A0A840V753_9BACT|nr:dethiobiotin synthase [Haloferula luteola]MBB5353523.1 dethiobiotin synthetase [Haloferula luteola]